MFKKIIIAALAFASAANGVRVELATQCLDEYDLCSSDSDCCSGNCVDRVKVKFCWS